MKRFLVIILFTTAISTIGRCQVNATKGIKPFYNFYLYKKINFRWSVSAFSLLAMKSYRHDFWLSQFNFGAKYRINRIYSVSAGYGIALYKYSSWWDNHYSQNPNFLNTVGFHSLNLNLTRKDRLGKRLALSNELILQHYLPKFEKYQTRFQYKIRFGYRKNDLPLALKPYVQGAVYYYLNGVPINYYDDNLNLIKVAAPNGFHRYRIKIGTSFRPIAGLKIIAVSLFFAINREFNINGIGNDINTLRISNSGRFYTSYQFNNYNISGMQVNFLIF